MRDIGLFTAEPVTSSQLAGFVAAFARRVGWPFEKRLEESAVGRPPDVLYVSDTTSPQNGYFSSEEQADIEAKLGSVAASYISIHFTVTDAASSLAHQLAEEMSQAWNGLIDYSGAGGQLGIPPVRAKDSQESSR